MKGIAPAGAFNINNSCVIVATALKEFFVNGTPVEDTINSCDDIFQFQIIAKAGAKYREAYHVCLETQKTDIPLSVEYLKKLSDIIENRIPQSETDKELRSLFMLHKKVLLAAAPFDFESYLLYVEWEREPDKKFYVPRREVMHPVVQAMQDLIDDRLDLLTISMPPGTGKSTLGIFFLSWVMGRFPDSQSLASAHSGMLTRSFYDGVYQIITDSEYLWADVFPGVKMAATNSKEETIDLHKKHRFSTLTCRAINASLTGATRCDKILYADDLCSGIEEAMSKERLDITFKTLPMAIR